MITQSIKLLRTEESAKLYATISSKTNDSFVSEYELQIT